MKATGLFTSCALFLLFLISSSAAWPWPAKFDIDRFLVGRQEQRPSDSASNTAAATDETSATSRTSASGTGSSATITGSATSARSGSGTTNTRSTQTTPIDPRKPPGGISLITPAPIDGPQYYKVGTMIPFQWNYTSLLVTPKAIDVLASCAINSATYTIASNMSVEETGAILWDTGNFPATSSQPFPVASYTLIVHDSDRDISDVPSAGHLGAYAQYVFGMYTGQPYVPLNEFKCATCNGALSIHEKQALGVLLTAVTITTMSFAWFANGFGVF
ncbi:hypothetical protein B0A52_07589 [Exophiala mesophila]|uniref:DUF7137 domain-containing protein n=1 Tax=Exophiala mesophila TaxID=212818 RepID=A0A438MY76_EXOME|nr:hypothetical protein B0A52_07589 [Exophiala mesophila]